MLLKEYIISQKGTDYRFYYKVSKDEKVFYCKEYLCKLQNISQISYETYISKFLGISLDVYRVFSREKRKEVYLGYIDYMEKVVIELGYCIKTL